jgi:hypothetical protein
MYHLDFSANIGTSNLQPSTCLNRNWIEMSTLQLIMLQKSVKWSWHEEGFVLFVYEMAGGWCNSDIGCIRTLRLGLATSDTQTVFVGVTPNFLPEVDFVSSHTVLPPISFTKQDRKSVASASDSSPTHKLKLNSVALVRERTIPTERPPLVGEVSANFCG